MSYPHRLTEGVPYIVEYLKVNEIEELTDYDATVIISYLIDKPRANNFRAQLGDQLPSTIRSVHQITYGKYPG